MALSLCHLHSLAYLRIRIIKPHVISNFYFCTKVFKREKGKKRFIIWKMTKGPRGIARFDGSGDKKDVVIQSKMLMSIKITN